VICNKPPLFYDSLQISLPSAIHTLSNKQLRQQLLHQYENLIQQTKTDLMAIHIAAKQAKIYQYQTIFNFEIEQMYQNNHKHIPDKSMPRVLQRLISKRSVNMNEQLKLKCNFTINYDIRSSYSQLEVMNKRKKTNFQRIGFLSNLIIDPTIAQQHHLINQQVQLLNRGPTYVAPYQIHLSSSFSQTTTTTMDNRLAQQYATLRHQLAIVFDKFHVHLSTSTNFHKYAYQEFKNLYSIPISQDIYQRALYEKKLIQSTQYSLQKHNLILRRTADQKNMFYLSNMNDFINVSNQYMENNIDTYYILINISNEMNQQAIQEQLNKRYLSMNSEIEKWFNEKRFNTHVHKKLRIKIANVKLPYLYFLPDVSSTTLVRNKFILFFSY
jgi:hypothetical protein